LAQNFGAFAAKDELQDQLYLEGLTDIILSVAPHKALIEAFQRFAAQVDAGSAEITDVVDLFTTARIAELASYGQIADQRVRSIKELQKIVLGNDADSNEDDLQKLIAQAPWLIHPTWTVLSENKALKTFVAAFEKYYRQKTDETVTIDVGHDLKNKRPDFTAADIGRTLHIVEIKSTGHAFDDDDWDRLSNYVHWFGEFFKDHPEFDAQFAQGYQITLVADSVKLKKSGAKVGFDGVLRSGKVHRISWNDFLLKAQKAHEQLLEVSEKASALIV
jgi:hypothetical protein